MNAAERKMEIFKIISERNNVEVNELAEMFNVSGMTIRRDLNSFEKQGLITTTYGGAYLNKNTNIEPNFSIKSNRMVEEKRAIAQVASKFISEGDNIIIDCGTTTMQIAKFIQNMKLNVITNSWPLINYLGSSQKIKLLLMPGYYDDISAGAISEHTINFIKNFKVDKVFLGTLGWDIDFGATVPEAKDAEVKKALLEAGKQSFLLADGSKLGSTYFAKHGDLIDFDYVITSGNIDEKCRTACNNLIVAG